MINISNVAKGLGGSSLGLVLLGIGLVIFSHTDKIAVGFALGSLALGFMTFLVAISLQCCCKLLCADKIKFVDVSSQEQKSFAYKHEPQNAAGSQLLINKTLNETGEIKNEAEQNTDQVIIQPLDSDNDHAVVDNDGKYQYIIEYDSRPRKNEHIDIGGGTGGMSFSGGT
jgi:hypothetical protein